MEVHAMLWHTCKVACHNLGSGCLAMCARLGIPVCQRVLQNDAHHMGLRVHRISDALGGW